VDLESGTPEAPVVKLDIGPAAWSAHPVQPARRPFCPPRTTNLLTGNDRPGSLV